MNEEKVTKNLKQWLYKGILLAEMQDFPGVFVSYSETIKLRCIIWTDLENDWNCMIVFLSSNGEKAGWTKNFGKKTKESTNVNETYILNEIYKFPLIKKHWYKNESADIQDILSIIWDD